MAVERIQHSDHGEADYSPYTTLKRTRLEERGLIEAASALTKGAANWPAYRAKYMRDLIEPEFRRGITGRLVNFLYKDRSGSDPDRLTRVGLNLKIAGNSIAMVGHGYRFRAGCKAIAKEAFDPDAVPSTVPERIALGTETSSALANILSGIGYLAGVATLVLFKKPASRWAMRALFAATGMIYVGESFTWIANSAATMLVEGEKTYDHGEINASAYAGALSNTALGVTLFHQCRFLFREARIAAQAGNVTRANRIMAFYDISYEKQVPLPLGRKGRTISLFNLMARLAYGAEILRLGTTVSVLAWNYYKLDDPSDDVTHGQREKNIGSLKFELVAGALKLASIPFLLRYPINLGRFGLVAAEGVVSYFQSRYDHKDETVAAKA